jgi:adenylate cyclase
MKKSQKIVQLVFVVLVTLFASFCIYLTSMSRGNQLHEGWITTVAKYAEVLENKFYDFRFLRARDKEVKSKKISLVHIDDLSLEKIGRWPWSRNVWVEVIEKLQNFGAKVVSFDIFFSEPEVACNAQSPDEILAQAIKKFQSIPGNKIVLPYSLAGLHDPIAEEIPGELYNYILDSEVRSSIMDQAAAEEEAPAEGEENLDDDSGEISNNINQSLINRTTIPVPPLMATEPGLGYLNTIADLDGIFRHFAILANIDSIYFPSFSLNTYTSFTGDKPKLVINELGEAFFQTKTGRFQLNKNGETKIRYFGDVNQFDELSVYKLLQMPDSDARGFELFKDKIVYIGATAIGAHDIRHTPLDPLMPGVYVHMNLTEMLLSSFYYQDSNDSIKYSFIFLFISVILLVLVQFRSNAILDILALIAILGISYYIDHRYLITEGYEIRLFFTFFSVINIYGFTTFINFYIAQKDKKQIKGAFSRMIAPAIVNEMLDNPDKLKLGGEKKDITCMFSDVRDFTSISEKLTPEQLSYALNVYMTDMTNILFEERGTLDKYIGDAIVGYWGAPLADPDHAYHAIKGSKRMVESLPPINERFKKENLPLFKFGIGLNSGVCSVGNMGSDTIFSYTALGDNMNLGARLEGLCKPYGVQLMISEFTYNKLSEDQKKQFVFRKLDMVRVKGKEKAVTIYEVFHDFHHLIDDQKAQEIYAESFEIYTQQKFNDVIKAIDPYIKKYPEDKSFIRLKENCEYYLQNPPPSDWDGVTTFKTK